MEKAAAGAEALKAGNYSEAVLKYTEALAVNSASPDYYIKRSTAHQRSTPPDNQAALEDAEKGIIYARKRAKRELIAQAQLRRTIALFMLERYADAHFALGVVKKLDEKEKTLAIWEKKVGDKLQSLPADDPKRKVTIAEVPDESALGVSEGKTDVPENHSSAESQEQAKPTSTASKPEGVQTPADKIKHDWYQNNDSVYFSLLVKGVPKDKATIDIQPRSLSISFPMPNGSTYDYSLEPLFAEVDASESLFTIMNTKIEVVLKKKTKGTKWKSLETTEPVAAAGQDASPAEDESIRRALLTSTSAPSDHAPAYPTSAKGGAKNWDKIVDSYTKKPSKKAKAANKDSAEDSDSDSEPKDDDAIDDLEDDDGGDPANAFFKKLYSSADPDTRRAMVKSYQESNGTALSTNWAEVGKGKVETSPPDGMVARKWGE
ncbi:MAG: hypothetical protein M1822_004705 [Bathelium mastoideum]|nr:MAG: hypothetical protein M1822_004705 [Bathelium mastoideum]